MAIEALFAEKAPSGYGLGVATPETEVTDCNTAVRNGWYKVSGNASNAPWALSSWLRVDAYNENYLVQTIYNEASGGRVAQRTKASTWGEWGWDNPPMVAGIEYRTTKRFKGSPVYAILLELGYYDAGDHVVSYPQYGTSSTHFCNVRLYNNNHEDITNSKYVTHLAGGRYDSNWAISFSLSTAHGGLEVYAEYTK